MTTTAVKEKPILFSAPMVKAILEWRKMQTRMIVKPQPVDEYGETQFSPGWLECDFYHSAIEGSDGKMRAGPKIFGAYSKDGEWGVKAPYWPGDRLWVRETWHQHLSGGVLGGRPCYRADDRCHDSDLVPWKPSIFMPRWASRITLEVTEVKVERLQEIGCGGSMFRSDVQQEGCPFDNDPALFGMDEIEWFINLWESINGKGSWAQNPWVWAISFKRL